jgi:aldose sugar dehydrogenase
MLTTFKFKFPLALLGIVILNGACQQSLPTAQVSIGQSPTAQTTASNPLAAPAGKSTTPAKFKVETIATGLEVPWDIEALPDGRIFVLERAGRIRILRNQKLDPTPYPVTLENFSARGQGGLMDMTLHPDFANNKLVYLSYTVETNRAMHTRVARFRDTGTGLVFDRQIFSADPVDSTKHFGSRIGFGQDRKLYITLGERGKWDKAQDLGSVNGKTLRLQEDGTIPADNPFVSRAGAKSEIFSYGNRNAQAMAFQPVTGLIWQAEHGPSGNDRAGGGDEINIIEAGKNYGWPIIHHSMSQNGLESPLREFTPATAPGGAAFYTGDRFPQWQGNLFVANLRSQSLQRFTIDGRQIVEVENLLSNTYGRLRAVTVIDGYVYVSTSNGDGYGSGNRGEDTILRLSPQ